MKNFSDFTSQFQIANDQAHKHRLVRDYLHSETEANLLVSLSILFGFFPKRLMSIGQLKNHLLTTIQIPEWLFDKSMKASGDQVEVLSLIFPIPDTIEEFPLSALVTKLNTMQKQPLDEKLNWMVKTLKTLHATERYIFLKIITGSIRRNSNLDVICLELAHYFSQSVTNIIQRFYFINPLSVNSFDTYFSLYVDDLSPSIFPEKPTTILSLLNFNFNDYEFTSEEVGQEIQIVKKNNQLLCWISDSQLFNQFPESFNKFLIQIPESHFIFGKIITLPTMQLLKIEKIKVLKEASWMDPSKEFMSYFFSDVSIVYSNWVHCREINFTELENKISYPTKGWIFRHLTTKKECMFLVKRSTIVVVILYAERDPERPKEFTTYSVGARHGNEFMTIAKANLSPELLEKAILDSYLQSIIVEKIGPIRTFLPHVIVELSYDYIQPTKKRRSGIQIENPVIIKWLNEVTINQIISLDELKNRF